MIQFKKPHRLKSFDYRQANFYFVTMTTAQRLPFFGKCHNSSVSLSPAGEITQECWASISKFNPHVIIDEYIVMPNHIHGILYFESNASEQVTTKSCSVNSLSGSLANVICGFKAASTKRSRFLLPPGRKLWQESFYEHVIRSEVALFNIRKYIRDNPVCWYLDELNPSK